MFEFQKLSEVADLTVGYVGNMGKEYTETGITFLRSLNIAPFSFNLSDIKYIPEKFHKSLKKSELHTNDVVIVRTGLPGTCAVIPPELDGCNCADLVIVRPNTKLIDPFFLCAFINSWGRAQVSNVKVGAVQKHFNVTSAAEMLIPKIDLENQKAIAKIIRNLNDKIMLNNSICADLESMAKQIYDYWFIQFDFPDENGKSYKSSGGKMVWNKELNREIPEGWSLTDIVHIEPNIVTGKTPSTKEDTNFGNDVPFITIDDIRNNMFVVDTARSLSIEGASKQANKYISAGSLCVTCIATVGLVGFAIKDSQTNQQINSIVFQNDYNRPFFYFAIKQCFEITSGAKTGNTFANMNKEDFSKLPILYNSYVVAQYYTMIRSCFDEIQNRLQENQQLTELRDFLLPMLMNGQIKIEA